MGFLEGYATGEQSGGSTNPFGVILSAIGKSQARRYAEDKERKKEERTLTGSLLELGKKFEYDKTLKEYDAKVKKEELLFKGLTEGNISETTDTGQGTFEGTPFGVVGQRYKQSGNQEAITDENGNIVGYRPKGSVFQPKQQEMGVEDIARAKVKGSGKIRVKRKSDGIPGTIDMQEFDPNVYERL